VSYYTILGWIFLSAYLAIFGVSFVFLSRIAAHTYKFPILLVLPIIWCGIEWVRKNLLGGFSYASLEHTQYQNILVVQIADIIGEYGIGMFIVFIGTVISQFFFMLFSKQHFLSYCKKCIVVIIAVSFVILYGQVRLLSQPSDFSDEDPLRLALLQSNSNYHNSRSPKIYDSFNDFKKCTDNISSLVDVVVWTETSFPNNNNIYDKTFVPQGWEDESDSLITEIRNHLNQQNIDTLAQVADEFGTTIILGIVTSIYQGNVENRKKNSLQLCFVSVT
jgi:apolipoprotein N-acyltransferase